MGVAERSREAEESLQFPKLGFWENAKMHHTIFYQRAFIDLTAVQRKGHAVVPISCIDAIKEGHKAKAQSCFIICGDTDTKRGDFDGISIPLGGWRRDISQRKAVVICHLALTVLFCVIIKMKK